MHHLMYLDLGQNREQILNQEQFLRTLQTLPRIIVFWKRYVDSLSVRMIGKQGRIVFDTKRLFQIPDVW